MGLYVVTGTMGGGKSYFAAEMADICWKQGGIVHSLCMPWNFERLEELGYKEKLVILPDDLSKWVRIEKDLEGNDRVATDIFIGGAEGSENLVIIDEAGLCMNSMHQAENKKKNETLFRLITMSRQIGLDIYILIQASTSLDVFIRNIAEATIHLRHLGKIPKFGWFFEKILGTFQRLYLSPQTKKIISKTYVRFNPYVGGLYKTTGVGDKIAMRRSEGRKSKSRGNLSMGFVFAIGLIIAAVCWGGFRIYRLFRPAAGERSEIDPLRLSGAVGQFTSGGASSPSAPGVSGEKPKPVVLVARRLDNSFIALSNGDVFSTAGQGVRIRGAVDNGQTLTIYLFSGATVTVKLSQ